MPLTRNTSSPPGRSSRAASGIQRYGSAQIDAPYSEIARSNDASAQRDVLGARLEQRELEPEPLLHRPRGLELRGRHVHADRPGAQPREPCRHVRGPAAELDRVLAGDLRERAELRLRERATRPS